MNEEAQRIAIAEACGWTDIALAHDEADTDALNPVGLRNGRGCLHQRIPDYLNDLNAMHAAEKTLNAVQEINYAGIIAVAVKSRHWNHLGFDCLHATARQRAEAFLRTIGKWEEHQ